ncbi:MAG: hypothetical protein KGJ93_04970 [Patescibacteria group bacterium]|nr:hypothetical protein [Patescibacteria group bacterium]
MGGKKRYLVMLLVGKHAHYRLQEMSRALMIDPQELRSMLLEKMLRKLKRQPDTLPWVSKLFIEIGEPLVCPTQASLRRDDYFTLLSLAHSWRLGVGDLANRLIAVGLPFWEYQKAIGHIGRNQQEELRRGLHVDLAIGFAQL